MEDTEGEAVDEELNPFRGRPLLTRVGLHDPDVNGGVIPIPIDSVNGGIL